MQGQREKIGWELLKEKAGNGGCAIVAAGASMTPALVPGDELHLAPPPRTSAAGDVLVYRTRNGVRAHRFIGIGKPGGLKVRGDNAWKTETVRLEDVFAAVEWVRRDGAVVDARSWKPKQSPAVRLRRLSTRLTWEARLFAPELFKRFVRGRKPANEKAEILNAGSGA